MIISKTPYRISFFGGGSDYPEWFKQEHHYGEVISTTIDKYIYLSIRKLPKFFKHKYFLSYSNLEKIDVVSKIKHKAIRKALIYYNFEKDGLSIHYNGDMPSRSGLGSSSAFCVGLIHSIYKLKNQKISKLGLAKESIFFEKKKLTEMVGCQDQIACSYGGFNKIKFFKNNFTISKVRNENFLKRLNKNLFLVYTGQLRYAQTIAKSFVNRSSFKECKTIYKILDHVELAKKYIKNNLIDDFGSLLNDTWIEKKKLSSKISNKHLDDIYDLGMKNGALGGKILGAGGGGFMLFYVPLKNQTLFQKKFNNYTIIPFNFSKDGSKIIHF